MLISIRIRSLIARSMGQHGAHLGPPGPRWAPCWPNELCYLGCRTMSVYSFAPIHITQEMAIFIVLQIHDIFNSMYKHTITLIPLHHSTPTNTFEETLFCNYLFIHGNVSNKIPHIPRSRHYGLCMYSWEMLSHLMYLSNPYIAWLGAMKIKTSCA